MTPAAASAATVEQALRTGVTPSVGAADNSTRRIAPDPDARRARHLDAASRAMRQRLLALSWWRAVLHRYPGGVVPLATAGRILGISPRRMAQYVAAGRVLLVEGMPGGSPADRFVPIDFLFAMPTRLDVGRPTGYTGGEEYLRSRGARPNPWADMAGDRDMWGSAKNSREKIR